MQQKIQKFFIALFAATLVNFSAFAQYPKLLVQFSDKNNSPYSLSTPSDYLSKKAIKRRTSSNIIIDSSDLPVNPFYIDQVAAQGQLTYLSQSKWLNQVLIYCTDKATIKRIKKLPFVKSVIPIGPGILLKATASDKFNSEKITPLTGNKKNEFSTLNRAFDYGESYNQIHIHHGDFLHNKGFAGEGMTIAIIDAGFYHYKSTAAFDSARLSGRILGERDFVDFDNSVDEDNSHGEYCLSTIAANDPGTMVGTAPHAKFWLLRGEDVASEFPIEEHNWVAAAEFADSVGADLISSSLGYNNFDDPFFNHTYADFYHNTTMVSQGASYAAKKGMIVTNSAGNEGSNAWKYLIFPADTDSVCSVGAINTSGQIASFSSFGYPGKVKPNIVSVGSGTVIYTPSGVSSGSGTSFSNPNINGLIACLWQAFPQFNNMTILDAVYRSSDKRKTPDDRFGFGVPNMKRAYNILLAQQNLQINSKEWIFASLDMVSPKINIKLIGQADDEVNLNLLDENDLVLSSIKFNSQIGEIFDKEFLISNATKSNNYTIQYRDSKQTRNIAFNNNMTIENNWIKASPIPFDHKLTLQLNAIETGKISIRLMDANGYLIESKSIGIIKNNLYNIEFNKASMINKGVYYIQYLGVKQNKTIKVVK